MKMGKEGREEEREEGSGVHSHARGIFNRRPPSPIAVGHRLPALLAAHQGSCQANGLQAGSGLRGDRAMFGQGSASYQNPVCSVLLPLSIQQGQSRVLRFMIYATKPESALEGTPTLCL